MPILILDDDSAFRGRLTRALVARGCNVIEFSDASEAHAQLHTLALVGAIVDLRLSHKNGPDGLWFLQQLHAIQPMVPIVVLTGFGSIATAIEAVRLGARDYLTKPADPDQILAALRGQRLERTNPKDIPAEYPTLDRVEWEHIERVLAENEGNISQAARLLGLNRRTLQRKLAKHPPTR